MSESLTILWENKTVGSYPYDGSAVLKREGEEDLHVWFNIAEMKNMEVISYHLYTLDDKSWEIVNSSHKRYQDEVGNSKDYGVMYSSDVRDPSKGDVIFKVGYSDNDLNKTFLCDIEVKDVLNPFPYIIL